MNPVSSDWETATCNINSRRANSRRSPILLPEIRIRACMYPTTRPFALRDEVDERRAKGGSFWAISTRLIAVFHRSTVVGGGPDYVAGEKRRNCWNNGRAYGTARRTKRRRLRYLEIQFRYCSSHERDGIRGNFDTVSRKTARSRPETVVQIPRA